MNLHPNSKLTPTSRASAVLDVLERGWSVAEVAERRDVSARTIYKWLARYRTEGEAGLQDRSSAPHRVAGRTRPPRVRRIVTLRRRRWTAWQIAQRLRMARSTVSAVLARVGLGRLRALDPKPRVQRYEKQRAGELLHVDIKKLARIRRVGHRIHGDRSRRVYGAGWEYVHVAIDDASRVAYVEVLDDERAASAVPFLERAVAWYRTLGIQVEQVMTDNGSAYRSHRHRHACERLGIRHRLTRPYTPRTNGKAERFIGTLSRGWAYGRAYRNSATRTRALTPWLEHYNHQRPHRSLDMQSPMTRLKALS